MTAETTEHAPEAVAECWAVLTFQHGRHDGCEEARCFETEDAANRYARRWANDIHHTNSTEHEVVVMRAVRTFRGPRSWADL